MDELRCLIAETAFEEVRALLPDLDERVRLTVTAGTSVIPETGEVLELAGVVLAHDSAHVADVHG